MALLLACECEATGWKGDHMLEIIGFVAIVALVYSVKAVAVMKTHDELAVDSTSFSWASVRPEDVALAESWTVEEPAAAPQRVPVGALRHVGA